MSEPKRDEPAASPRVGPDVPARAGGAREPADAWPPLPDLGSRILFVAACCQDLSPGRVDMGMRLLLEEIGRAVAADRVMLHEPSSDGLHFVLSTGWTADAPELALEPVKKLDREHFPWCWACLNRRERVVVLRLDDLPPEAAAERELLQAAGVNSLLALPLIRSTDLMGYLSLTWSKAERSLTTDELVLLALAAEFVAATRARIGAEAEVERRSRELTALAEQVHAQRQRLSRLSAELTSVEEEERRRIARDVHDRVGQPLGLARMLLTAIDLETPEGQAGASAQLKRATDLLGTAIAEARSVTRDLYPPVLDSFGLGAAVEGAVAEFEQASGVRVLLDLKYHEMQEPTTLRATLFRALKELLFNVAKHARASSVAVTLHRFGDELHLVVVDDGAGFDVTKVLGVAEAPRGLGLFALTERIAALGGRCEVRSIPGHGTRVEIATPIMPARLTTKMASSPPPPARSSS